MKNFFVYKQHKNKISMYTKHIIKHEKSITLIDKRKTKRKKFKRFFHKGKNVFYTTQETDNNLFMTFKTFCYTTVNIPKCIMP